ncbi:hypothetical protein ACIQZI_14040 [Peribacillus sp. NPDC096379]|uniref:hypothetical protein n=1 Tax=Peribacillus sp. NPDC096379 TaxID=3364393 RepID=UPI000B095A5F
MPGDITFVDNEHLFSEFSQLYRVLYLSELNEPLVLKDTNGRIFVENENELNDAELYNLKHWKNVY